MPTLADLNALVEKFAAAIPNLNLDGDEQEEYSTMLLWLQNQVETDEPMLDTWKYVAASIVQAPSNIPDGAYGVSFEGQKMRFEKTAQGWVSALK